jgi:hypothetical protein
VAAWWAGSGDCTHAFAAGRYKCRLYIMYSSPVCKQQLDELALHPTFAVGMIQNSYRQHRGPFIQPTVGWTDGEHIFVRCTAPTIAHYTEVLSSSVL